MSNKLNKICMCISKQIFDLHGICEGNQIKTSYKRFALYNI